MNYDKYLIATMSDCRLLFILLAAATVTHTHPYSSTLAHYTIDTIDTTTTPFRLIDDILHAHYTPLIHLTPLYTTTRIPVSYMRWTMPYHTILDQTRPGSYYMRTNTNTTTNTYTYTNTQIQ